MKVYTNTPSLTKSTSRIGSAIVLVLGACLIIPKIADSAGTLNYTLPKYSISYPQNAEVEYEATSQNSSNGYEPPDFGSPVSAYGSSTR